MKYETLILTTIGPPIPGSIDYVFNFTNNIDHVVCLYYKEGSTFAASQSLLFNSINISGNILTVNMYAYYGITQNYTFMMATVASY